MTPGVGSGPTVSYPQASMIVSSVAGSRIAGYSRAQNSAHSAGGSGSAPAHFGHGHVPARREQRTPRAQAGLEPDDVDRALAPDQIEGARREVRLAHVADASLDAIGDAKRLRVTVCFLDKRHMVVDRDEVCRRVLREDARLQPGPASEVEHASLASDPRDETQRLDGARGISRSLPGQSVKDLEKERGRSVLSHVCILPAAHAFRTSGRARLRASGSRRLRTSILVTCFAK